MSRQERREQPDKHAAATRHAFRAPKWKFLAEASALLETSLDYQATLEMVLRLTVPTIADWAAIALRADDGALTWHASVHRDPAKASLVEELRQYGPSLTTPEQPVLAALRSGREGLVSFVDDEYLRSFAQDDAHLSLLRRLEPRSYMILPLTAREQSFGSLVLCATHDSERSYTDRDMAIARELAVRVSLAIDHAVLHRALERAVGARDAMVAIVAHDLKNPLSTVQMAATFLLEDLIPDDADHRQQRATLNAALRATHRMFHLIHDLLDVTAMEAGHLTLQGRALQDVTSVITEAVDSLRPLADAKQIRLECDAPDEIPPAFLDRERLLQVFSNLGGNAIKFTPRGGNVTIRVRVAAGLEFSVIDDGPGIPEPELPHVFDRFWQAKATAAQGTGLGLAIAKGIVEAHGGSIVAMSRAGEGAEFLFTIPGVHAPTLADDQATASTTAERQPISASGRTGPSSSASIR